MLPPVNPDEIFSIGSDDEFNKIAVRIFNYQHNFNPIYGKYCQALKISPEKINHFTQIPFLPVQFFKNHKIISGERIPLLEFTSSGTTGSETSTHYVIDPAIYIKSFLLSFRIFYGNPDDYHILALLPGYMERMGSSLIYMVEHLIKDSNSSQSGFYLNNTADLVKKINSLTDRKILLLGVSFALLDLAESKRLSNPWLIVMETGGMKGRRKEPVRNELHKTLGNAFGVEAVHSEYGMTELLSQAYSAGNGIFSSPPWMKVLIREPNDPFSISEQPEKTGGVNIVDLANINSCSFIATQDIGKLLSGNRFEITGRFDNSDIRGCNLLVV